MKRIIIYRLYDSAYGERGNAKTLSVLLDEDNCLSYVYYGGWQDSGMGFSISNMQLQKSLPTSISRFKNSNELHEEIKSVLATGLGANKISSYEILNELKQTKPTTINVKTLYYYSDEEETIKVYDVEAMREEFESQLNQLINS
jgi:hypothetical protein